MPLRPTAATGTHSRRSRMHFLNESRLRASRSVHGMAQMVAMQPSHRLNRDERRLFIEPAVRRRSLHPLSRSHPAEHYAQIVCWHFRDNRNREPNSLRRRCDRFEVSQTPGRIAIAKASIELMVAGRRFESFAFVWTVEIKRRTRREYCGRTLDQSERRVPR